MNNVGLGGYVVRDPKIFDGDKRVAKFSLAVKDYIGNTNFINCAAFGKQCDYVEKRLQKGTLVNLVGKINTSMREMNGVRWSAMEVHVLSIEAYRGKKACEEDYDLPDEDDYPFQ